MIHTAAVEVLRANFATAANLLILEMEDFMPGVWPPHRYDAIIQPDGAFVESTVDRSAPNFPGRDVRVPEWQDGGAAYTFATAESDKVGLFKDWLFTRRDRDWLDDYFATAASNFFREFGTRSDREFEGEKFPRDEWKAGSFDSERWDARRQAIGNAASVVMMEFDRVNTENVALAPRSWIVTKFVEGPLVGGGGSDITFANVPEILADVSGGWVNQPAFARVSAVVGDNDPTWTAAGASFAAAANYYGVLFSRLRAVADDFIGECITLWRTGSQTARRGR